MENMDVIGKKFGKVVILERDIDKKHHYICKCECGNKKSILFYNLKNGITRSCGCYKPRKKQLKGKLFGKLLVVEKASNLGDKTRWLCQCECGNSTIVSTANLSKKIKGTKSCGCLINAKNRLQKGEASFNRVCRMYKYSAKKRKIDFNLTKREMKDLTQKKCYYCDSEPSSVASGKSLYGNYVYNGIDRIDSNKGYEKDNCVACCSMCNMMKKDYSVDNFLKKVEKIYNKHLLGVVVLGS